MKITKQLILPLALLFMLAYARGQDIHYNYDRGANFQSYRTYQWVDLQRGPRRSVKSRCPGRFAKFAVRSTTYER